MLFAGREVRIGKNCALGLEHGPRPTASGRTQDLGHSFSLYGPPGRQITYIYISDRHRDHLLWNSFQNLCVFCRGKVSGERLISNGTYCQFRTREYSMAATSMKTLLFSHCHVCCSGEWISCELYTAVTFHLFILGEQVCDKRFKVEC